ncbi:ABC transporter substrate-binding protein [Bradyrhizobium manausense]|uniref:ABC transporter substrate-binding protein n=1 Tax=Bradyrhizobium manausense TaxID=989370 RepID=UPI001BA5E85D|nr:ABC transporter substrate-binding protein [Bradyrhizobium manausense]MBR1092634.1 ABC transporter substrate-binding protein [Bradyrhizobium manausense]
MKRRTFISLLGASFGASLARPVAAGAQQARPVVGYLGSGSADDQKNLVAATLQGLKEAGFTAGQNVTVEFRWADGQYERLPALAEELVKLPVSLIIAAGGSDPGRAAQAATSTIPIVFITAADPVKAGLVTNLNRGQGNITGISMIGAALEAKRLELLHEILPQASIGVMINPFYPAAKAQAEEVEEAVKRLGLKITVINASTPAEVDAAFAKFDEAKLGAVLACNDPFYGSDRTHIAALALHYKLPAMSFRREFAEAGGLASYGALFAEGYRQTGIYAGKVLAGARPADLPVMQPTKFELVINLKTAKAIGLAISEAFLLRADEIIE